jgi:hypothetical protein
MGFKISTNLPASEEAFENGVAENTISLQEALTPEGAAKISSFGGVIISATLFGNNYQVSLLPYNFAVSLY